MSDGITPSPEQAAVRDHPLLPLRVTAGAGTGKTTTISLRLAALVDRGEVEPEQALGITFTNKAAEELADRLRAALPDLTSQGREIEVTTYHGFALGLLREFGPLVGVERSAGLVTPGYARQLLRDALGEGTREALDLTAPGMRVDELVTLAGQLGDHLVTPDALPGDGDDDTTRRRAELADALARYELRKRALGIVDFADLVSRAHRLASGFPEIAERIRGRYRVVLLDEYQDTNPAQRELLRVLFGSGFPVTAVGDPDQTIYEWRGASLENFAAFPRHFPCADGSPADDLPLSFNRRSGHRIVELANAVRAEISGITGLERLTALEEAPQGVVQAAWFHSAVQEARWIAEEIVRLHDEDGVAWRDVGVLFRRHRQIALVREALEREGVPVEVAALGGLLDVPEVADLHAWLRIIARPDDAPALMRVLLGHAHRLGLGDLAPLAAWVRARYREVDEDDLGGVGWALLEAIDRLQDVTPLSAAARERLGTFATRYRELLAEAQGVSLVELCRRILDRTGVWQEVEALDDAARLSARLNLYRFLDLGEEWSPIEGAPSLEAFIDYLDLLVEDRATDELDTARVSGEDAVALLTVHRAKGLEWPVVVLPALCDGVFPSGPRRFEDPDKHPQFLPGGYRLDGDWLPPLPDDPKERAAALRRRHMDQEWRTAYVAVTRSAARVVCTGAWWYTEKVPKKPSPLYELAAALGTESSRVAEPGDPPETLRFLVDEALPPDPAFASGWLEALREAIRDPEAPRRRAVELGVTRAYDAEVEQLRITLDGLPDPPRPPSAEEGFRTSVTALVTFASCPQRFFWSEVDRLPRRPSPSMRAGVELHRRIELDNRGAVPLEEATDSLYDVPDDGDATNAEGAFAAFRKSRFASSRPRWVEAPFELKLGKARIGGRIDAIYEPEPGTWEIVDFKAGRRRDDPALDVQLQAYALAARRAGFAPDPPERIVVTFAYLGGGLDEVPTQVDDEWLAAAELRVSELLSDAAAGERSATPGAGCRRCDFAQFCDEGTAWLQANP